MKKLCIMAFTMALLAWASTSQATILSASYTGDQSGALDSTASWDQESSQLTITGTQNVEAGNCLCDVHDRYG